MLFWGRKNKRDNGLDHSTQNAHSVLRMFQTTIISVYVPGVRLLVLLRDKEPNKISITQPPFLIHPSVSVEISHTITIETRSQIKKRNTIYSGKKITVMT